MEGIVEDMWTPYKYLYSIIENSLANVKGSTSELESCLKKYKQNFTMLLKNPPKNERNRKQLRNGVIESTPMGGQTRKVLLSKDLIDETIIISDMFDLDEFIALELLCTAQRQTMQHPGLPRGLIAVLLYYDGRKALAYTLRDLFQVTSGISWVTHLSSEMTQLLSNYTQSLVDDSNVLERVIDLLDELDISKESALLTKNRAFGPKKHQNQIIELFEEIRIALATALFNWSAQRGLPKPIALKLMHKLFKYNSTDASGTIDDVALTMLMALIYSFDTSILQRQEDSNPLVLNLPIMCDPDFAVQLYDNLVNESAADGKNRFSCVVKFAFGLSLASLRHVPQNLQNTICSIVERDEQLVDDAIFNKVFEFIYYNILEKNMIYKNEFFYRRLHSLFTDFIDFMHSKVTELRGRADETAKTVISFMKEGLEPPKTLDYSFEMLLLCIGKFYKGNRAGLSLCMEYWGPLDVSKYSKATTRSVSLFKFIRLAGELLPTTLFVPYLKMIAGLTSCERSARNVFNLLKQSNGLSGSSTLSWEHFFGTLARYYSNLRQEQGPGTDTIYKSRIYSRSINPQEIEGLHAVLEVIRAVATYDDIARIAICEHPNWVAVHVLFGLLCCSVPLLLKSDILKTLAALAKSKETAHSIWNALENSQIIATILTSSTYNISNLEVEIDQNETRIESYPLSQGILDLLQALVSMPLPKNLGGGPRKPGFDPYLTFILNKIFLKFYNRTYKNPIEKWEVGEKCLKLFYQLLQNYQANPNDFEESREQNAPPGFHIMLQLHTKSDMLRIILMMIDDVCLRLDEYKKFHGKDVLEEAALHCLQILECGLVKQGIFFEAHSAANSSIMLSGLNKMLLDVNPRSRRPDHILNITKFITYNSWLPQHSLLSTKILSIVSRLPNVTQQILGIFSQDEITQNEIRQGFVECLESDIKLSVLSCEDNYDEVLTQARIELQLKESIIELLQNSLTQPMPNLTHYLLGFDVTKDVFANPNQKLFSVEANNNCTKSLILLLDNHLEIAKSTDIYDAGTEKIIERAYALLFSLCTNHRTSDIVLRYMRSVNNFLNRHLMSVPYRNMTHSHVLNQISYLLKCIAVELKITASSSQISRFQNLCERLIGAIEPNTLEKIPLDLNTLHSPFNTFSSSSLTRKYSGKNSLILTYLLDNLCFETKDLQIPKWEFFDYSLTEEIFNECEIKSEGRKLINIKKLHQILSDELHAVQSTIPCAQRKLILQEIDSVLLYALKANDERNRSYATIKLMEAWGQVAETLFSCAPELALPVSVKQDLIIDLLQKILHKVVPTQPQFEISILASGTVLLLLVNLRHSFLQIQDIAGFKNDQQFLMQTTKSNSLNLKFILKHILEWIILSGVSSQKLRINLYASLLTFIQIVKGKPKHLPPNEVNEFYVSRLDKTLGLDQSTTAESGQIRMSVEVILSCGDKLIDIICNDCISGHDICKMSALSCVGMLLDLDAMTSFINFICNRGYLMHIIESLMKSDDSLCRVLSDSCENMRILYVYESKMAMLLRVAGSFVGAELLLSNKILEVLSSMKVFDMHPDFQESVFPNTNDIQKFVPPVGDLYRQILFPALNLCESIISTLGTENHSAVSQIMHFLISHMNMVEIVLRAVTPFMDLGLLKEFAAVTGLIARTTNQDILALGDSYTEQDIGVNLHRIQRLMLSAFSRFTINETTFKEMIKPTNVSYELNEANKSFHMRLFLEIASNLSLYCRNSIANHSADHKANGVIFSPNIMDAHRMENRNNSLKMNFNLSLIIEQLKGSVAFYNSQSLVADAILRQRGSLPNISFDSSAKYTYMELSLRCNEKQHELDLCVFIIEQCLYLLWSHLDFYMRSHIATNRNSQSTDYQNGNITLTEMCNLKKNLVSIFNETFCKQLLSTSKHSADVEKGFIEALLRRIKYLIQFVSTK